MAKEGYSVKDVTHVLVPTYHMDHGGIAQEMKDKGAKLIVMESQKGHLNDQKKFIKPPLVSMKSNLKATLSWLSVTAGLPKTRRHRWRSHLNHWA